MAPRRKTRSAGSASSTRRAGPPIAGPRNGAAPAGPPVQRMIFLEENQLAPAPDMQVFNITMIGPVLIQFGTDGAEEALSAARRQCRRLVVPGLFRARRRLRPRRAQDRGQARRRRLRRQRPEDLDLDRAHGRLVLSAWCAPTRNAPKRQEGISFLLIDMKTPGITVRPIISIDGTHHLNEVFFDDVRVPVSMRVYEENKGWDVAKFLLGNERTGIARLGRSKERVNFAKETAREMRAGRPAADRGFRVPPARRAAGDRHQGAGDHPAARRLGARQGARRQARPAVRRCSRSRAPSCCRRRPSW